MRTLLLSSLLVLGLAACDNTDEAAYHLNPLVPDSTVFVASTLEYSPDTSFYHTQVYVGRLSTPHDNDYRLFADRIHKPTEEMWMPIQWVNVGMRLGELKLRPHPDNTAEVVVTGPLGRPEERAVTLTYERRGVYGDLDRAITAVPLGRYRLDVRLADGRHYAAETTIPEAAAWSVPEPVVMPVDIGAGSDEHYIIEEGYVDLDWVPAPSATLTVWGANRSLYEDRKLFGLQPHEEFPFQHTNDWLRAGAQYYVFTTSYEGAGAPGYVWAESSVDARIDEHDLYLRLYQLSPELARHYPPEDFQFGVASGGPWARQMWGEADVVLQRDTNYFPSISNVYRVGTDGNAAAENDAVGVFGSYSARYARTTMVPDRAFDADTVRWGNRR